MELSQFPQAIADAERLLLKTIQGVNSLKEVIEFFDREISYAIAFDPDLKNDTQRKVRRGEMQADQQYQDKLNALKRAEDMRAAQQIEADYLKNSFSVAKIEARERIAKLENLVA